MILLIFIILIVNQIHVNSQLYSNSVVQLIKSHELIDLVLKSKQAWFLNFCLEDNDECIDFQQQYELAANQLSNDNVKFGYVDIQKETFIVNFFGINGNNVLIFLNEQKPGNAGSPSLYNWPPFADHIVSYYQQKRQNNKPVTQTFSNNVRFIQNKAQLDSEVMSSQNPWFLLFCQHHVNHICNQAIEEFEKAAESMKAKKIEFGFVDLSSDIVRHFGIQGMGVVIFLNSYKPAPYGSPQLVGENVSQLFYEKFFWQNSPSEPVTKLKNQNVLIFELTDRTFDDKIMNTDSASIVQFYSYSMSNLELEKTQLDLLNKVYEQQHEKLIVARLNVDYFKQIVNEYDIWPLPCIIYFPLKHKVQENFKKYDGVLNTDALLTWAMFNIIENEADTQIHLKANTFFNEVINSDQAWFVYFYTTNRHFCPQCQTAHVEWKKLSQAVLGKINIAKLNCDHANHICQKLEFNMLPHLQYFAPGPKQIQVSKNIHYNKAIVADEMTEWILNKYYRIQIQEPQLLLSQDIFNQYYENFDGICIIIVFQNKDEHLERIIYQVNKHFSKEQISFLYSENGQQAFLNDKKVFNVWDSREKTYPYALALENRVGKLKGFKILFKEFNQQNLVQFIQELIDETRAFIPLKKQLIATDIINSNKQQFNDDL